MNFSNTNLCTNDSPLGLEKQIIKVPEGRHIGRQSDNQTIYLRTSPRGTGYI